MSNYINMKEEEASGSSESWRRAWTCSGSQVRSQKWCWWKKNPHEDERKHNLKIQERLCTFGSKKKRKKKEKAGTTPQTQVFSRDQWNRINLSFAETFKRMCRYSFSKTDENVKRAQSRIAPLRHVTPTCMRCFKYWGVYTGRIIPPCFMQGLYHGLWPLLQHLQLNPMCTTQTQMQLTDTRIAKSVDYQLIHHWGGTLPICISADVKTVTVTAATRCAVAPEEVNMK